jgi:hypothetical protein
MLHQTLDFTSRLVSIWIDWIHSTHGEKCPSNSAIPTPNPIKRSLFAYLPVIRISEAGKAQPYKIQRQRVLHHPDIPPGVGWFFGAINNAPMKTNPRREAPPEDARSGPAPYAQHNA